MPCITVKSPKTHLINSFPHKPEYQIQKEVQVLVNRTHINQFRD